MCISVVDCSIDYCTGTGQWRCKFGKSRNIDNLKEIGLGEDKNCMNVWKEEHCVDPTVLCLCPKKCRRIFDIPCESIKCR